MLTTHVIAMEAVATPETLTQALSEKVIKSRVAST